MNRFAWICNIYVLYFIEMTNVYITYTSSTIDSKTKWFRNNSWVIISIALFWTVAIENVCKAQSTWPSAVNVFQTDKITHQLHSLIDVNASGSVGQTLSGTARYTSELVRHTQSVWLHVKHTEAKTKWPIFCMPYFKCIVMNIDRYM